MVSDVARYKIRKLINFYDFPTSRKYNFWCNINGENSYSFVSEMSMRSSQLSDFDKISGKFGKHVLNLFPFLDFNL